MTRWNTTGRLRPATKSLNGTAQARVRGDCRQPQYRDCALQRQPQLTPTIRMALAFQRGQWTPAANEHTALITRRHRTDTKIYKLSSAESSPPGCDRAVIRIITDRVLTVGNLRGFRSKQHSIHRREPTSKRSACAQPRRPWSTSAKRQRMRSPTSLVTRSQHQLQCTLRSTSANSVKRE